MRSRNRVRSTFAIAWIAVVVFGSAIGLQDLYGQERSAWIFVAGVAVVALALVALSIPLFYGRSFVLAAGATYVGAGGWLAPFDTGIVGIAVFAYFAAARGDQLARVPGRRNDWRSSVPSPFALGVILLVAVLIAPVVASLPDIPPVAGEPGEGEITSGDYWGFGEELDLAHRFELGDHEVMRVRAARPDLWRGQTFDHYDGRTWTRRASGGGSGGYVQDLESGLGTMAVVNATAARATGAEPYVQVFHYRSGVSDLVFAANDLWWAEVPTDVRYVDVDGTVRLAYPLGAGSTYTAFSYRADPSPDDLRRQIPTEFDPMYSVDSPYLQVPSAVPERVHRLALDITASSPTTYDKVRAIEEWMDDNITYVDTRNLPALPEGDEAVDHFLFEERAGFCEQIGTSAAILLRTLGIPTRLATGFAPGETDDSRGEFVVRAKDAHAWVEVWFPETGWVGFDPTSGVPVGPGAEADAFGGLHVPFADHWWVIVLVVLAGAVARRLIPRAVPLVRGRTPGDRPAQTLVLLESAGSERGVARARSEPVTDYARRLHDERGAAPGIFTVAESLNQTFYADRDPETIDWDAVDAAIVDALSPRSDEVTTPPADDHKR